MLQFFIPPVKSKDPLLFLTFRSNLRLPARIDFPKPEPDELKLAFPALCDVSNRKHCGNAKEKKLEQFDSKCHLMPIPTCTTTQLRTSGRLYLKMMEEMLTPRFATDIRKETLERNIRKETSEKGKSPREEQISILIIMHDSNNTPAPSSKGREAVGARKSAISDSTSIS